MLTQLSHLSPLLLPFSFVSLIDSSFFFFSVELAVSADTDEDDQPGGLLSEEEKAAFRASAPKAPAGWFDKDPAPTPTEKAEALAAQQKARSLERGRKGKKAPGGGDG